jgi:hypothetical protein
MLEISGIQAQINVLKGITDTMEELNANLTEKQIIQLLRGFIDKLEKLKEN